MGLLSLFAVHLLCLFAPLVFCHSEQELLPYEPTQYLKTHLPAVSSEDNLVWRKFLESSPQEAGDLASEMKKNLKTHLAKTGTSVVFAKGERVLVQRRTHGMKWDTQILLPYTNMLSLMSVALPILLENYKSTTIENPIGEVLRGSDRDSPVVKGYKTKSFLDVLNTLSTSDASSPIREAKSVLKGLESNGKMAVYFSHKILDKSAQEAWLDALMGLGMPEVMMTKEGQLVLTLKDFIQYSLTIMHEFKILADVPKSQMIDLADDHYLFGWWINCPTNAKNCLLPTLPSDTIFSLSPSVRMYVVPSLELTLIITAKGTSQTISDILREDEQIWNQIYSVLSSESSSAEGLGQSDAISHPTHDQEETHEPEKKEEEEVKPTSDSEREKVVDEGKETGDNDERAEQQTGKEEREEESGLVKFIHWIWPPMVFVFWVTVSHVWVYWLLHGLWFLMTKLVKRAHVPRPKTAADVGQN